MNNLFNKNKQLTDKLPDLPEVLDEVGTSNKSERNKMMISLAPESTFDLSNSLFSTMDGECSAIIKLNPPLKKLEDSDSTMDGECSAIIKLNPPLSWPVIVDEDGRAAFSIANLFCSLRNSWTLELNSSTKDPEGENA